GHAHHVAQGCLSPPSDVRPERGRHPETPAGCVIAPAGVPLLQRVPRAVRWPDLGRDIPHHAGPEPERGDPRCRSVDPTDRPRPGRRALSLPTTATTASTE